MTPEQPLDLKSPAEVVWKHVLASRLQPEQIQAFLNEANHPLCAQDTVKLLTTPPLEEIFLTTWKNETSPNWGLRPFDTVLFETVRHWLNTAYYMTELAIQTPQSPLNQLQSWPTTEVKALHKNITIILPYIREELPDQPYEYRDNISK